VWAASKSIQAVQLQGWKQTEQQRHMVGCKMWATGDAKQEPGSDISSGVRLDPAAAAPQQLMRKLLVHAL
jgi:hypothetical protein